MGKIEVFGIKIGKDKEMGKKMPNGDVLKLLDEVTRLGPAVPDGNQRSNKDRHIERVASLYDRLLS